MQWSQIKTLFILSFLILNIYLAFQLINKQKQADLGILDHGQSTFEEVLESENITVPDSLPDEVQESFISVRQKVFTEEDIDVISGVDDLDTVVINKHLLVSIFDKEFSIPDELEDTPDQLNKLLQEYTAFPDAYTFWRWNKDLNVLIFFQKENDRPVYFNQNGILLVFLDEDNNAVFYTQTMLDQSDDQQEKRKLISAMDAIEKLHNSNELRVGDDVTTVDIGFHTRVPLTNGVQVFVPVWKITVDEERHYFVNAIEGHIFSSNELKFLEESMTLDIERMSEIKGHKDIKKEIESFFKEKLDAIDKGETE